MASDPNEIPHPESDTVVVVDPDDDTVVDPDLEPYDESMEKPLKDSEILSRLKICSEVLLLDNINWR